MSSSTGTKGKIASWFNARTARMRVPEEVEDRKYYKGVLRRRRTRVICIKLLANLVYLFARSFVTLNKNTYAWAGYFGGNFWRDFSVYTGVSVGLPLFSFIGLLRDGALVSQVWFEGAWLLGVSGFDGYLVWRQTKFRPSFTYWAQQHFSDPYLTVSVVLYVLAIVALVVDLGLSLLWSVFLWVTAWLNRSHYPTVWFSQAEDFQWLSPGTPPQRVPLSRVIWGEAKPQSPLQTISGGLLRWLTGSTMFRQYSPYEPISHSIIRGCVAVLFWISVLIYGTLNCIINPIRQFTLPKGLPSNSLTQDSRDTDTYGHITGFIALDVAPFNQYSPDGHIWRITPEQCASITGGIQAHYTDPTTNQGVECKISCAGSEIWNSQSLDIEYIQIEAVWDCGAIWDTLKFRTSSTVPSSKPFVSVNWNSSAYITGQVISAGIASVPVGSNERDFFTVIDTLSTSPREWKHGVTFNLTSGQSLRVDVGRRKLYANRATFLDLIGISQSPNVFVTYPILSLTPDAASPSPVLTTLSFHAGFGAFYDEIYEEYLEHTVISGISATGGLYSFLEVIYIFVFGRSLLAVLFGGKHITPFGAIASILYRESFRRSLQDGYPGIDAKDPTQRVNATCSFLTDFVLDLKPLDVPETHRTGKSREGTTEGDPGIANKDSRSLHTTIPTLT